MVNGGPHAGDIAIMMVITDFGDLAVLLPLSVAMLVWLLAARSLGGAAWWLAAVALCMAGTALLKVYFIACPIANELSSPSGHSSFSTLVYGGLAMIIAAEVAAAWQRLVIVAAAVGLVAAIAVSRLVLGAHGALEIGCGAAIGLASLSVFAQGYLRRPPAASLMPLLVTIVMLISVLHGRELRAEEFLHAVSRYFLANSMLCA
jgi:membrane-associated phospholipid phosphatase